MFFSCVVSFSVVLCAMFLKKRYNLESFFSIELNKVCALFSLTIQRVVSDFFMSIPFIHLRVHSEFSLVDSVVRLKKLAAQAVAQNMPAVALTDESVLFGLVKFQKSALGLGVKPIFGVDIWVEGLHASHTRLCLLAKNHTGYKNITQIVSDGYIAQTPDSEKVVITLDQLRSMSDGVIVLSGGRFGAIAQSISSKDTAKATEAAEILTNIFPNHFYLEVQRLGLPDEEDVVHGVVELAQAMAIPIVATNEVVFLSQDDFSAHEVRVCINQGEALDSPTRVRNYTSEQFFKTTEQMQALFHDLPQAIENSYYIAQRCTTTIPLGKYYLPNFPVPEGMTEDSYFRHISEEGLKERLEFLGIKGDAEKPYWDRLHEELDIIIQMGFPGYFLIVMDFIKWSKENDVPVGPGRGSGAGSLVAYAQKITDLDPLEYDLLFERFLNPERVSMPDFDIDFCMSGRDRVIDYVSRNYGKFAVSQIVTFGTMAAKAVVRDVARVQGKSYSFADRISKLIPFEVGMTLSKAMEMEPQLGEMYSNDEDMPELWDMAIKLEGMTRNTGKHAGGVVIAPTQISDFSALYCDTEGENRVTQFDKDDVEAAGLVKFDFLGLKTLTVVDLAVKTQNTLHRKLGEPEIDIARIPLDDSEVFALLQRAETTAVFQLESRGMKDLIKRLEPNCFEEIVALVALFRPGPLQSGMVDDFINRKHGRQEVTYPHPSLEPILENTYGVILYQEQVMQIAQVLALYTLGGADMLRRAMGKKKPEEMAKQRILFMEGAANNEVDKDLAGSIFDLMEKFAGYGFNKSHSAAYALVSYQTAWLKTKYPASFMASVLSNDMQNTDKVVIFVDECKSMGLKVLTPHVNSSELIFTVNEDKEIVYGLGAIKGVGEGPIEAIIEERKANGPFKDLFALCDRIQGGKLNKRVLESLIYAGALDELGPHRACLIANIEKAVKAADQNRNNETQGIIDMFASHDDAAQLDYIETVPEPERDLLQKEYDVLGHYMSGHPLDIFAEDVGSLPKIRNLQATGKRNTTTIAGLIVALRFMRNKRGDKMAFVTIDDSTGQIDITLLAKTLDKYESFVVKNNIIVCEGEVSIDDFTGNLKMMAKSFMDIDSLRAMNAKCLKIKIVKENIEGREHELLQTLEHTLFPFSMKQRRQIENYVPDPHIPSIAPELDPIIPQCPVELAYVAYNGLSRLRFGEEWTVAPKQALLDQLIGLFGKQNVKLEL